MYEDPYPELPCSRTQQRTQQCTRPRTSLTLYTDQPLRRGSAELVTVPTDPNRANAAALIELEGSRLSGTRLFFFPLNRPKR
jgi:hypothetical protein